jgi:hypothetical protein
MITYLLTKMFYFLFSVCGPLRTAAGTAERRLYNEHLGDIWVSKYDVQMPIISEDVTEPELDIKS